MKVKFKHNTGYNGETFTAGCEYTISKDVYLKVQNKCIVIEKENEEEFKPENKMMKPKSIKKK